MEPDAVLLQRIVERVVEAVKPLRIVLFGSAARGTMGPDSDIDLLVVMPDGCDRNRTAGELYVKVRGIGRPMDCVVTTESHLRKHGSDPWLVFREALEQGREIYRAVPA